ncbi:tetratricopeptide repeat protein [Mitsuaria sp. GD03876]|uniref:tetratricopeptide repeat protein n=1 Tax=Mitsuaria sp. GD03876 TaxID=2975399 RepID=UPI002448F513|nr:tetratricopeptide repeat protein [Mitsuaria sp. GD03876]MDH0863376.1 tetratricopeptide repeat protein [Mitsuaria sp. GD03876]
MTTHQGNPTIPTTQSLRANLERLLASGRDGAMLRYGLGQALLREEQFAAAEGHLREATRQDPSYSAAWKLLGKALERLDRGDEAEVVWHHGLEAARERGDLQSIKEIEVFLKRRARARQAAAEEAASAQVPPSPSVNE